MKVKWLSGVMEISWKRGGCCSVKNSISSGRSLGSGQGSEAGAAPGTHSQQRTWSLAGCSLSLGMGWWTVPPHVCHLCLPTVGSQHLMSLLGLHITLLPLFLFTSHTAQSTPHPFHPSLLEQCNSNIHLLDFLQTSHFVLSVLGLLCSGSLLSEIASWTHRRPEKQSKNNH